MLLDGKVALVSGGGRGIGRAHALALAQHGAKVLLNDLGCDRDGQGSDPSVAAEVAEAIRRSGGDAFADAGDVGQAGVPERLVRDAIERFGRLDIVISAAGIVADKTVLKFDEGELDRMYAVHVRGNFALVRAAGRAMIDSGFGGSLVLHTAPVAFFGALRHANEGAMSAAVVGLVRSAAIELRKHRVRVNAIAPTARTRATEDSALFRGIAPDSMGPEFVAPLGVFLASHLADEVTGEVLGCAGTRLYTIRGRESPGHFGGTLPATPEEIARHWASITRS
jgi:NAD(P)-dependent dehydrogenase (short-subunit alcohol dehydrogenase family)